MFVVPKKILLFTAMCFYFFPQSAKAEDFYIPEYHINSLTLFTNEFTSLLNVYEGSVPFEFDLLGGNGGFGILAGTILKIPMVDFLRVSLSFTGSRENAWAGNAVDSEDKEDTGDAEIAPLDYKMNNYVNAGLIFSAAFGTLGFFGGWYSEKQGIETIVNGVRIDTPAEKEFRFTFIPIINTREFPYLSFLYKIANYINSDFKSWNATTYHSDWQFSPFHLGKVEILSLNLYTYRDIFDHAAKVYAGGLQAQVNFLSPSEDPLKQAFYEYFGGTTLTLDISYRHFFDYPEPLLYNNGVKAKIGFDVSGSTEESQLKFKVWGWISASAHGAGFGMGAAISSFCFYGELEPAPYDGGWFLNFGFRIAYDGSWHF